MAVPHPQPWTAPKPQPPKMPAYARTRDPHLQDFLGPEAAEHKAPGALMAALCKPATEIDTAWFRTPLYSATSYNHSPYASMGGEQSPSPTFYKRASKLGPKNTPHAIVPARFALGSNVRYRKANTSLGKSADPHVGLRRVNFIKDPFDNTIGDCRYFTAIMPTALCKLGLNNSAMHRQQAPVAKADGVMPREPANGFPVKIGGQGNVIMCSSPMAMNHMASPSKPGERMSIIRPSALAAVGKAAPSNRNNMLRWVGHGAHGDPFELFPHEFAQCGNGGQKGPAAQGWAKGSALESGATSSGTYKQASEVPAGGSAPLWQQENGVQFHRNRICGTPYQSIRPNPSPQVLAELRAQQKKNAKQSLQQQLAWIAQGQAKYKSRNPKNEPFDPSRTI